MDTYITLIMIGAVPVLVSMSLAWAFRAKTTHRLSYRTRQIIAGLIFGAVAICATEFGVPYEGTMINARDAAPLCAGLIFGPLAGIISGLIGGIERWFAVYWGVGYFTRTACTIATILAGFIAALLRKYMFDDHIPTWGHAALIAIVTEVIHMLMIFITNGSIVKVAFTYVQACTAPMVTVNTLAVGIAVYAVSRICAEEKTAEVKKNLPTISEAFQNRLIFAVLAGYLVTSVFSYVLQSQIAEDNTNRLFALNLQDAVNDVLDQSDEAVLATNRHIATHILTDTEFNLSDLKDNYGVYEINIVGADGIIHESSDENNIGINLHDDRRTIQFLKMLMLGGPEELVLEFLPTAYDPTLYLKYSAVRTANRQLIQIAYDGVQMSDMFNSLLPTVVANRHIGENGGLIVMDHGYQVVYSSLGLLYTDEDSEEKVVLDPEGTEEYQVYRMNIQGEPYYYMFTMAESYYVATVLPVAEADFSKNLSLYLNFFMLTIIFGTMFVLIYLIIKYLVVGNIQKVNTSLAAITDGNLDTVVDVRYSQEFNDLSDDINETVGTLKQYIAEANARIDAELRTAREIQRSALPSVFPEREEFDLYALMNPAKEVGGDFYDFYFLDRNRLMFLVADVSGKGIPASLFMMRAKTLLKTFAENQMKVNDNFTNANQQLCEGNDAGMFVTAWMGNLNLETGVLRYVNAGHNRPLIRRKDGQFEFLKGKVGFVLAGLEGMQYKEQEITLQPGDEIFLYTDGVVEATNAEEQLYGDERLLKCINEHIGEDAETLCTSIRKDVREFYSGAPQYDDITELSVQFRRYADPYVYGRTSHPVNPSKDGQS